ncbi:MAG: hypothetical protein ACI9BD_000824 [Candidatus Marinamargulisbacteria bacterium]|jgi:hypothetical protein
MNTGASGFSISKWVKSCWTCHAHPSDATPTQTIVITPLTRLPQDFSHRETKSRPAQVALPAPPFIKDVAPLIYTLNLDEIRALSTTAADVLNGLTNFSRQIEKADAALMTRIDQSGELTLLNLAVSTQLDELRGHIRAVRQEHMYVHEELEDTASAFGDKSQTLEESRAAVVALTKDIRMCANATAQIKNKIADMNSPGLKILFTTIIDGLRSDVLEMQADPEAFCRAPNITVSLNQHVSIPGLLIAP